MFYKTCLYWFASFFRIFPVALQAILAPKQRTTQWSPLFTPQETVFEVILSEQPTERLYDGTFARSKTRPTGSYKKKTLFTRSLRRNRRKKSRAGCVKQVENSSLKKNKRRKSDGMIKKKTKKHCVTQLLSVSFGILIRHRRSDQPSDTK